MTVVSQLTIRSSLRLAGNNLGVYPILTLLDGKLIIEQDVHSIPFEKKKDALLC